MAATKAMNLYMTTCRYVIQANPYDAETWSELYRYLPYLRQALSCCVCSQLLQIPMGPPADTSPCQHHVCRACLGGKMRLKPACAWCKDYDQFSENPILRTTIQCFKKLCEYLASSGIALSLTNAAANGGTNTLMAAIQDGLAIKDDYNSPSTPQLGLFPPKLQKVNARRGSKEERNKQCEPHVSFPDNNTDEGQGHLEGIGPLIICEDETVESETTVTTTTASQEAGDHAPDGKQAVGKPAPMAARLLSLNKRKLIANARKKKRKRLTKVKEGKINLKPSVRHGALASLQVLNKKKQGRKPGAGRRTEKQLNSVPSNESTDHGLYETVAAEHDYNKGLGVGENTNAILKVRIRKVEGDHESLVKKTKHIAEPILPSMDHIMEAANEQVTNGRSLDDVEYLSYDTDKLHCDNNNTPAKNTPSPEVKISQNKTKHSLSKKKIVGCRCGLATPNPGKLTCCGQRCPCYSAFKGCTDCRCRGCRNPRGDTPSPNSIRGQLQKQHIQPQALQKLGLDPQLILTPVTMENDEINMHIDI